MHRRTVSFMHRRTVSLTIEVTQAGKFIARYEVVHKYEGVNGYELFVTLPHTARFVEIRGCDGTRDSVECEARRRVASIHNFPDYTIKETTNVPLHPDK